MIYKRTLIMILTIIYLIIYYYFTFIVEYSNKNYQNSYELEYTKNLLNQEENLFIKDIQNNKNFINIENESDSKILDLLSNTTLKNTTLPEMLNTKINSDGSDIVTYKYKPSNNLIEVFDNTDKIKPLYPEIKTPRYIWVYWENINRSKYPTHIKLCLDTMKKHLDAKYKLKILNEKTIKEYLPNIRNDFDNLMVAQKVDYYRIALLYKYGGIWLDADIIIMKDLEPIFKKLDQGYDYVGFGCTGAQCSYGKFRPSNWVLGARPQSVLMELILNKLDEKLNSRDKNQDQGDDSYHDYGKMVLWEALDDLKSKSYDYYHFSSEYDGTRDTNKNWVHTPNFFLTDPTKLLDESKVLFIVLYNSEISNNSLLHWIRDCDDSKLLYSNIWLGHLYRKALGLI